MNKFWKIEGKPLVFERMTTELSEPPSKKRKLDRSEDDSKDSRESDSTSLFSRVMNCKIEDLLPSNATTKQVTDLKDKLRKLGKDTDDYLLSSIDFSQDDAWDTIRTLLRCPFASVADEDELRHPDEYKSECSIMLGAAIEIAFFFHHCAEYEHYELRFGDLWDAGSDQKIKLDLKEIKALVKKSGIKGVGSNKSDSCSLEEFIMEFTEIAIEVADIKVDGYGGIFGSKSERENVLEKLADLAGFDRKKVKKDTSEEGESDSDLQANSENNSD